jgi:hypothetical protein
LISFLLPERYAKKVAWLFVRALFLLSLRRLGCIFVRRQKLKGLSHGIDRLGEPEIANKAFIDQASSAVGRRSYCPQQIAESAMTHLGR